MSIQIRHLTALAAAFALATLAACGQVEDGRVVGQEFGAMPGTTDPQKLSAVLASPSNLETTRLAAEQSLLNLGPSAKLARDTALCSILINPFDSDTMRTHAADQWPQMSPVMQFTAAMALPRLKGAVLEHACRAAERIGDKYLLPYLAAAMDSQEGDPRSSPAWTAAEKIAGEPAEQLLWEIMIRQSKQGDLAGGRRAALNVLQRIRPTGQLLSEIAALKDPDAWLATVQWWAANFDSLPTGAQEHAWIATLREPAHAELLQQARQIHALLRNQPDYLAAPRFVALLAATDPATAKTSRENLIAELTTGPLALSRWKHIKRPPSSPGAIDDVDNRLTPNLPKLSRADLLTLHFLATSLDSPNFLKQCEKDGLADLADTKTEHGGLLRHTPAGLELHDYPPIYPAGDTEYVASDALLHDAPLGIALYHFHFQQTRNEDFAGPGTGDMDFAENSRVNCLVITSIDKHQLDFQYYTPAGAVVDLGVRTTPNQ